MTSQKCYLFVQYANSISYKYRLAELCILPYAFGLHRLPAPAPAEPQHWTRERLDTLRQHQSGRRASSRSGRGRRRGDSASGRAAQRSKPEAERQKSQSQHDSSGDTTDSRQPATEEPQRSTQSQRARSAAL